TAFWPPSRAAPGGRAIPARSRRPSPGCSRRPDPPGPPDGGPRGAPARVRPPPRYRRLPLPRDGSAPGPGHLLLARVASGTRPGDRRGGPGRERRPHDLSHVGGDGAAPLVTERGNDVQPAARFPQVL